MLAQVVGGGAGTQDDVGLLAAFQFARQRQQLGEGGFDHLDVGLLAVIGADLLDQSGHGAGRSGAAQVGDQRDHAWQVSGVGHAGSLL
ncbi:hypothetical protein D3C79_788650 [compost metagenome]